MFCAALAAIADYQILVKAVQIAEKSACMCERQEGVYQAAEAAKMVAIRFQPSFGSGNLTAMRSAILEQVPFHVAMAAHYAAKSTFALPSQMSDFSAVQSAWQAAQDYNDECVSSQMIRYFDTIGHLAQRDELPKYKGLWPALLGSFSELDE
jgi:hypothetical protein